MSVPQFTAEASLWRTNGDYQAAPLPLPFGPLIVPALCSNEGECGPCINGFEACCVNGRIRRFPCGPEPPVVTCGPCVGFRQCSDGSQRSCSV